MIFRYVFCEMTFKVAGRTNGYTSSCKLQTIRPCDWLRVDTAEHVDDGIFPM
jgi:hypothetical protein